MNKNLFKITDRNSTVGLIRSYFLKILYVKIYSKSPTAIQLWGWSGQMVFLKTFWIIFFLNHQPQSGCRVDPVRRINYRTAFARFRQSTIAEIIRRCIFVSEYPEEFINHYNNISTILQKSYNYQHCWCHMGVGHVDMNTL